MNFVKLKEHLDRFLPLYVIVVMILGLLAGVNFNVKKYKSFFHMLNVIVVISMIYPMMINLRMDKMKKAATQAKHLSIGLLVGLVVAPLIMWLLIYVMSLFHPVNPQLGLGLMLSMVVPCSSMSIAYTGLSEGNMELATMLVVSSFVLAIVTVPVWLVIYASSVHVTVPLTLLIITIIEVVFVPMFFGVLTRHYLIKKKGEEEFNRIKPLFPAISLIGMYIIVFLIFMEKAKLIVKRPEMVLIALIPLAFYYIMSLVILTYLNRALKISYEDHMAITFPSVGKNEGTAMAIAISAGMGLMAIAPAVTPLLQIPFLVGYLKMWRKIKSMYEKRGENNGIVPEFIEE